MQPQAQREIVDATEPQGGECLSRAGILETEGLPPDGAPRSHPALPLALTRCGNKMYTGFSIDQPHSHP